jgi:hypothetical protein
MAAPGSALVSSVDPYHQDFPPRKLDVPNKIFGMENIFGRICDMLRNGGCVGLYGIGTSSLLLIAMLFTSSLFCLINKKI